MKILDIPQSGKKGLDVSMNGRYGQVRRTLVIPTNPRTAGQMTVRANLSLVAKKWRTLTEDQREAWNATGNTYKSAARLGQSGALTGLQLFIKVNATLAEFGQDLVDAPPSYPAFPPLAPQSLTATNTEGVIALKLACPGNPGQNTIIRASAPQSAGRSVCRDVRILGTCPAPAAGSADITALYVAKFGAPTPGTKIFVQASQMDSGFETIPVEFSAIVPAS